jgi:predicted acylesterase/phospholipase RssA
MTVPAAQKDVTAAAFPKRDEPARALPYCDLVMKGGITSGVVYPAAVIELAKKFRFRRIGGASAGAIAAAGAAAAELGRNAPDPAPSDPDGAKPGFMGLHQLRHELTEPGRLLALFEPVPDRRARVLYRLFLDLLDGVPASVRLAHFAGSAGLLVLSAVSLLVAVTLFYSQYDDWRRELRSQLAAGVVVAIISFFGVLGAWNFGFRRKARPRNLDGTYRRGWWSWLFDRSGLRVAVVYAATGFAAGFFAASLVAEMRDSSAGWWQLWMARETLAAGFIGTLVAAPTAVCWYYWQQRRWWQMLARYRFGLAHALTPRDAAGNQLPREAERLTDFLHRKFNQLAGLPAGGVLTFGQLKGADVLLRLMTSNLSLQRPYVFPLPAGTYFLFKKSQFAELFPPVVVAHLTDPANRPAGTPFPIDPDAAGDLFYLPDADQLPVIVAVRISLSHPGLFSAVPLYAVTQKYIAERYSPAVKENRERAAPGKSAQIPGLTAGAEDVRETWFSDGGIVSNFPIHIFDRWFPDAPTFGINLADSLPRDAAGAVDASHLVCPRGVEEESVSPRPDPVHLPAANEAAVAEWRSIDRLDEMFWSVFYAAKNHRTNAQTELPGFRERIVTIRLTETEGGLNLNMPPDVVETIAGYGAQAGGVLATQLDPTAPAPQFEYHQWVRLRLALAHLERELKAIQGLYADPAQRQRVEELLTAAGTPAGAPPGYPYPFRPPAPVALEVFRSLMSWCDSNLSAGVFDPAQPVLVPDPVKRFVPAEGDDR